MQTEIATIDWQALVAAVASTRGAYDDDPSHKAAAEDTDDDERRREALLDQYDDAVEAALKAPAPSAEAMRWKLQTLEKIYANDETWDAIDALLPAVLAESQRFVRD